MQACNLSTRCLGHWAGAIQKRWGALRDLSLTATLSHLCHLTKEQGSKGATVLALLSLECSFVLRRLHHEALAKANVMTEF
eukprot:346788-Chlamydomonas_euryale.AAC.3